MPDPQAVADRFAFSDASSHPTRAAPPDAQRHLLNDR
jgi:hypothetical protein